MCDELVSKRAVNVAEVAGLWRIGMSRPKSGDFGCDFETASWNWTIPRLPARHDPIQERVETIGGEARRASDRVSEARIALERCELSIDPDDRRGCYDEKKVLQKAKQRLRLCEEKVSVVHKWLMKVKHEADEFSMQTAKMTHTLDADLPRASASLARMAKALEKYATRGGVVDATHQPAPRVRTTCACRA